MYVLRTLAVCIGLLAFLYEPGTTYSQAHTISVQVDRSSGPETYYVGASNLAELKAALKHSNVPDNISICYEIQGGSTGCDDENIGIDSLTLEHFKALTEETPEMSYYVLASHFER